MAEQRSERGFLICAICVTFYALLRVGVLPRHTPLPERIPADQLEELLGRGWRVRAEVAAQARQDVSNASGAVLAQGRPGNAGSVELSLVPIRVRSQNDLSATRIGSVITSQDPSKPATLTINRDQFLRFRAKGSQDQLATSCFAAGQARVSNASLVETLINRPISWGDRIRSAVGLQPPRDLSCLFITIRVPNGRHANLAISQAWVQIRPVLMER